MIIFETTKDARYTSIKYQNRQSGELAKSSEFYDMTHNEFQRGLQMKDTCSSWSNRKAEKYIQIIENIERRTRMDSGLLVRLWYQSTEACTEIYNMMISLNITSGT